MRFSGIAKIIIIVMLWSEVIVEDDTIKEWWLRLYFEGRSDDVFNMYV